MAGRYTGWYGKAGDVDASPALRSVAAGLLGELENENKLVPLPLRTRERHLAGGITVEARIQHGVPSVRIKGANPGPGKQYADWYVYAALDSDEVGVIQASTGKVKAHINLQLEDDPPAHFPYDIKLRPNSNELWVVCSVSCHLKILSTPGHEVIGTVDLSGEATALYRICFSPDGAYAYVSGNRLAGGTGVFGVSCTGRSHTHTSSALPDIGGGQPEAMGVAITPNGARLYVSDHSGQDACLWRMTVGGGAAIYHSTINCLPGEAARFCPDVAITQTSDGLRAVVPHLGWSVYVIDLDTDTILGDVDAPGYMTGATQVAIDPLSSKRAWVAARDDVTLNLINVKTISHSGYAQAFFGASPKIKLNGSTTLGYGVCCSSDGTRIYMGRYGSQSVASFTRSPSLVGETYLDNPTPPHIPEFIAALNGRPWALCTGPTYLRT